MKISEYLIDCGANINAVDNCGSTALHYSSIRGNWEYLYLMKSIQMTNGNETNWYLGHFETVKDLVKRKANVNAKNDDGKTAQDLAFEKGSCKLLTFI